MPRYREHHLSLPFFNVDRSRNMRLLHLLRVTRDLTNKFALFFLPIYLFQLGMETSLLQFLPVSPLQRGLLTIAFYYISTGIVGIALSIPFGRLVSKIGYQRALVLSDAMRLVQFLGLFYLHSNPFFMLFVAVALIDGANSLFFWSSYWTILSKQARRNRMGGDLGLLQLLLQIVAVVTPALSGILALLLGLEMLFLAGVAFALISMIIVLFMDTEEVKYTVSWKEFRRWLHERRYERLALSMAGKYINDATVFIWPLYVFLLLGSVDKVGYLYTISLFLAMIVVFFTGTYLDKSKNKKPFFLSGGLLAAVWLAKTQVVTVWGIAISDAVERLSSNVHGLYFDVAVLKRGKGSKAICYFIYRELLISGVKVVFWSLFAIFFLLFGEWKALFVFASLGVMLSLLIKESKLD